MRTAGASAAESKGHWLPKQTQAGTSLGVLVCVGQAHQPRPVTVPSACIAAGGAANNYTKADPCLTAPCINLGLRGSSIKLKDYRLRSTCTLNSLKRPLKGLCRTQSATYYGSDNESNMDVNSDVEAKGNVDPALSGVPHLLSQSPRKGEW